MVTLKEIAQRCNVSATTVSNILNGKPKVSEETRRMVLEVVKEMGYQPNYMAQSLRNQKTRLIGIIAEDIAQFTTPEIIESIMACCEEKGYRTIVQNLRLYARWSDQWYNREKDYHSVTDPAIQELFSLQVDGVIYIAGHARIIRCFPEDFSIPAVMAYAYTNSPKFPSVAIDDEKSSYEMVKYLLSMGHREIGFIGGRADNIHTMKRLVGYQKALYEENILFNPALVQYANWNRESGYNATEPLVKAGVSVIYCISDQMAGGAYDYLWDHGIRVGEEISVAGFDNQAMAEYMYPELTTTALPLGQIGHRAAEMLLNKIELGRAEEEEEGRVTEILVPCTMKIRNSVKRLKQEKAEQSGTERAK